MAGQSESLIAVNSFDEPEESCLVEDDSQVPEARFECPICLTWLRDPVLTSCGHRFCRKCIYSWLEKDTDCPVDKTKLNKDTDIFPDNFTRREISQQKTKCLNVVRGCLKEFSPLDIEQHLLVCKYKLPELPDNEKLRCTFVSVGCVEKFETDVELKQHLDQSIQNHLYLLSQAYNKFTIDQSSSKDAIAQQANFWDPLPKNGQSIDNNEQANLSNDMFRSLYERIIYLEQTTREQQIKILNMSDRIESCECLINNFQFKFCFGSFMWIINDFKTKISRMSNDQHNMVSYSPGFLTSPYGYKLCMRFNLSPKNPNYMALFVHMMKTEYDNGLDWPFNGRITITLIHPTNSEMNIKETMMTRPELEAFKKPQKEINPRGFGYTEFTLIEELFTEGYADNNQILIKVQVQPV